MVEVQKIDTVLAAWIVSQDVWDLTRNAIDSLKRLNGIRLIIVDNASPMGGGYLRSEADIYIRNKKNLGYAPAMNQGLKLATSDYIALAENDIDVSSNAFDVGREILDTNGRAGAVHFKMVFYKDKLVLGNDTWDHGKERWSTISFCLLRKQAIPLGGFDEGYITANYEDWDLLHQIRHIGSWQTPYTNKAGYKHHDSYTQKKLNQEQREKEASRNREYFRSKHGNYPENIWMSLYPKQMRQNWKPFP